MAYVFLCIAAIWVSLGCTNQPRSTQTTSAQATTVQAAPDHASQTTPTTRTAESVPLHQPQETESLETDPPVESMEEYRKNTIFGKRVELKTPLIDGKEPMIRRVEFRVLHIVMKVTPKIEAVLRREKKWGFYTWADVCVREDGSLFSVIVHPTGFPEFDEAVKIAAANSFKELDPLECNRFMLQATLPEFLN